MTALLEEERLYRGWCSCGVPGCQEVCWPHEWNCRGDSCVLGCTQRLDPATAIRYGSGYAHPECVEKESG